MRLLGRGRIAGDLWLPNWAAQSMIDEAEQWAPDETGGALMGYVSDEGTVVTDLIDGGPAAQRTRSGFTPDADYQLSEIAFLYQRSGRLHTYIGDWHTHPAGSPTCSTVDRGALKTVSRSPEGRCDRPLMIILAGSDPWTMTAWRYEPGRWWDTVHPMEIRRF